MNKLISSLAGKQEETSMSRVLVLSLLCLLSLFCTANGLEYFYCPTDLRPIPKDYVCDGYNDCPSGSDESDCGSGLMCESHEMMCSVDNKCINLAFQCDGISHCSDGSDEQNCNKGCDYQCSNTGKCISAVMRCDGRNDCGDNSDEESCGGSCDSETQWQCPSGKCLSRNWRCDGEDDCSDEDEGDSADEANCDTYSNPCGIGMFNCSSGKCINGNDLCDGFDDCPGGDDEDETICYVLNCKDKFFTCPEQCLERTHVCDGVYDCIDNRDEMNCNSRCDPDQFMCISGSCIRLNETCNGNVDCADGSDEFLCPNTKKERVTCDTNEFPCLDGLQCIPDFSLCDDIEQCADGSDENECPAVSMNTNECNSTDNGGCDHFCHDTVHYRYCSCHDGYALNSTDMSTCYDINECQENPHICTHYCTNTLGSFYCSCDVGYTHSEVYGCTANGPPPYLLFTNWFDIQKVNDTVSGSYSDILVQELRNAASLDYHYKYEYVYWTDIVRKVIMRAHLNGSDIREIVNYGISRPESLAIDWIHGLVYWTDSVLKRIEVSNLNGEKRAIIFSGLHSPRDIVIDPLNRLMFWIDGQQIFKASLDGTDKALFLSATDHVYWPVKLTIDYPTGTLYWIDVASKTIGKCHTDGSRRDTLYSANISNPSGLTVFENKVYWTERNDGAIYSANKGTGKQFETVLQSIYMPTDLALVHPLRQPRGAQDGSPNQCSIKRCQHLCIVGSNNETGSCYCPPSSSVEDDGISCSRPQLFILFSVNEELHTVSLETEDRYDLQIPIYYDDDGDDDGSKSNIISTDWDNNTVYYADSSLGTINSLSLSGGTPTVLVDKDVSLPVGIAIDWCSKKIYWTDGILSHIYVSELDGSLKTAVITLDEGTLTDIVVQPLKGYLIYGVKNGKRLFIMRANLDGSDNDILYESGVTPDQIYGSPDSLTVDGDRVYWVDSKNLRLESILLNKSDHEILYDNFGLLSSTSGLDHYGDKLYWTEKIGDAIRWVEKEPPYTHGVFLANKEQLRSISIYHNNRRIPDTHPCLIANGGCSHMCVGISSAGEDLIASCLCPTGYLLQQDKKNCAESIDDYIVIASEGSLGRISLDTQSGVYVTIPTPSYQPINPHSIAVDIQTNDTYWADGSNIYKNSGGVIKVIISSISERPTALAIDWIGRMLYWAEANTRRIEVSTLDGLQRKVLLSGSIVSEVSSIVLDMKHQYMFWAMPMASLENVYRANMDGTAPTPIIRSTDVTQPSSIAIDDDSKLYVADVIADRIYSFNLDGSHKRELGRMVTDPKSIVVDDDYLYWMNRDSGVLYRVDKHATVNNFVSFTVARNIEGFNSMAIKRKSAYDRRGAYDHHCAVKKCENICLPKSGGYQCACPTGIVPVGSYCPNVPSVYLLLSTTSTIRRISLDTNDFVDVSLMENKTHRIHDIAHYNSRLYWSESTNGVVYMSDANGTNVRIYNRRGDGGDISLDKSTGNLYYINNNNIEVSNIKHHKVLVSSEGDYVISSITVDSMRRKLYWVASDDTGLNYIMQSDVNGSMVSTLFSNESYHPVKLHLSNRDLYWIDTDTIQMLSLIDPDVHPVTVLDHGSTDIAVHNNLLFTINDGQVLQTDVKTGRSITVYTNRGSGNAINLHIVNSSYVQSHSSCTGSDCDHMCLSLSSRYYQCVCPDSLNGTACTEEIHFIPDATSTSAVPSSTMTSIHSSSPVSSATPTYQGPTISLSGDTSGGFTTGELVILLLIILLFIAVVITIVVIIVLYCKYKRMSEVNGVSTKIVKNSFGSNKLNNIPSSLPPLSNLPTRQLNNVSELDQKKKGGKNCNVQQKGAENEDFPIKKPAKPTQPLPSQSFTPQPRAAAPLQATQSIPAKPQSTSSQTLPAAHSAPTRPTTAKPPKPRPPPLPPITKTPIKVKRFVKVKFDIEDDDDAPPPIPPRSTTCTPTSPPYTTPSAPLVTPVTSFPVPISPPPVVATPPLSPGHMLVSAHNPLYDDSMDN